jgi:hypothetical protein
MAYAASAGIMIASNSAPTTFYQLTDHNRSAISISYDLVEQVARMADGTMRKFVVAKKRKVGTDWKDLPSGTYSPTGTDSGYTLTVDGQKGGAWIKSFYEANLFTPVVVRINHSHDDYTKNAASAFYSTPTNTASANFEQFNAFITAFDYTVVNRFGLTDIVNIKMEFTEI